MGKTNQDKQKEKNVIMLKAFKVNKSVFIIKTSTLNVLILLKITNFLANLQNLMHVKLAEIPDL